MDFKVFISHNINENNSSIIQILEDQIPDSITLYVAEHDLKPGSDLTVEIENAIADSDAIIVILNNDNFSEWVQQEIGYAKAHNKIIIPLVEKGAKAKGMIQGVTWIDIDMGKPQAALRKVRKTLDKEIKLIIKEKREKEGFLMALALGVGLVIMVFIMFIFMTSSKEKKEESKSTKKKSEEKQ